MRRLEACQSPVWDTALALIGLGDAGLGPDHPAVERGAKWLLGGGGAHRGDWAVRRPNLAAGGWAFEFENDWYPDIDDTAEVVMALRRASLPGLDDAVARGVTWTIGMESRAGGWGAFDADNVQELIRKLPFCDFGEVIDPPSADVTAHVVEMLAYEGLAGHEATRRGIEWLLREQEPDGSWFGRWGCNYVYGTGAVVPALVAAGITPEHECVRRAVRWLEQVQNDDGGWGEDMRSYDDPAGGARAAIDRVPDRLGASRAARGGRAGGRGRARARLARRHAAGERDLGRAVVHRHRFPGRLLHQLPPVPARLSRDRPGALRAMKLVVLAPLRIEALAVRSGLPGIKVKRSGMGRHQLDFGDADAIGVAGLCGAVDPSLRAGDVVLATELRHEDGKTVAVPGQRAPRRAARRIGLKTTSGTDLHRAKILGRDERLALRDAGVIASTWSPRGSPRPQLDRPVAVLRVVVDTRRPAAREPAHARGRSARAVDAPPRVLRLRRLGRGVLWTVLRARC